MDRRLRRAVLERLVAVEEITARTGSQPSVSSARNRLGSIADGWRQVLIEHQPNLNGRCPVCPGWLRRRRWPCQVWVTAHEHLIGGPPKPIRLAARKVRKSDPFRQPRRVEVIPRQVCASSAVEQPATEHPDSVEVHRAAVTDHEPAVAPSRRGQRSQA